MSHIEAIRRFVLDEFLPDVRDTDLPGDYDLVNGGVIDSLGLLKLIAWIEERFGLPVDDIELDPESFRTIDAVDAFITRTAPATAG